MVTIPAFSSVPGASVPGNSQPGLVQQGGTALYPYYGHMTLYYLDYLDTTARRTLVAVPGGSYVMQVANTRAGLTVPPPDGRWVQGASGQFMLRWPGLARAQLARARQVNADLQAAVLAAAAAMPRRPQSQGSPVPRTEPAREPSEALAAARRVNADLQARRLAGG